MTNEQTARVRVSHRAGRVIEGWAREHSFPVAIEEFDDEFMGRMARVAGTETAWRSVALEASLAVAFPENPQEQRTGDEIARAALYAIRALEAARQA